MSKNYKKISTTTTNGSDLMTVMEVAAVLRADETTIRRWIKSGALEAVELPHTGKRKQYRIRREVFEHIMAGGLNNVG